MFAHGPDQISQIRVLTDLAVHRQPDAPCFDAWHVRYRFNRGNGGGLVKRFTPIPWAAGLFRLCLQIAAGKINAHRRAPDVVHHIGLGNL